MTCKTSILTLTSLKHSLHLMALDAQMHEGKGLHMNVTIPAPSGTRIALGIDPGTAIVGYAVVMARGSELQLLVCDAITTPAKMPLAERLQLIYAGLSTIVATHKPQEAAMEELFFAKNARTAMTVGQARGVA